MKKNYAKWVVSLGLVVFGWAAACSDSDEPVKYKYPDYATFCDGLAGAECTSKVLDSCQTNQVTCRDSRKNECLNHMDPHATYQPAHATKCVEAAGKAYKDALFTVEDRELIQKECFLLWGGQQNEGDECKRDYDCNVATGLRCVKPSPGAASGRCFQPVEAKDERCVQPDAVCPEGRFCKNGDCVRDRTLDIECNPDEPCEKGLICVPEGEGPEGKCKNKKSKGEDCVSGDECLSGFCLRAGPKTTCADQALMGPNEPWCETFQGAGN